ncbi:MAG: asparagine synthase (glutamine-hydrolyzing) [Fluviicola sp.]|nr:asparagine synthase (glutamine-hydrolyzing) [Fluviicola sp.]
MCGIAGVLSLNKGHVDSGIVSKMTDAIAHRGPDGFGIWKNEEQSICLGHRRLSIIDLSDKANQPFHYKDRYSIVFNGEIYNYIELRDDLISKGYSFETESDTEVLIALYDLKKEGFLNDLDGMFAFAIWDKEKEELFCARDRFGEKPFYYTESNNSFYFASEIKALWSAEIKRTPKQERVFQYLAYDLIADFDHPETTFFENVFQLKPAHYITIKNGKINTQTNYWDIDLSIKNNSISFEDATKEFKRLFKLSVKRRLRSDVAVGSSLSGGLDSSSIVYTIQQLKTESQKQATFSARFKGFEKDEGEFIDLINKELETAANNIFVTEQSQEKVFDKVCYHQDEPFGSGSILAQYQVMQLAKENDVTVLLDGQGADEYLAGYARFFQNYLFSIRKRDKTLFKKTKINLEKFYQNDVSFHYSKYILLNPTNFIRKIRNRTLKPDYIQQFNSSFYQKNKGYSYKTTFAKDLDHALYDSLLLKSIPTLLRYADRNSMANSREVRLPFLYHKLVEFVFSLPDEYKIRENWTKAILRESMKDVLPEKICWRKEKVGFEPPNSRKVDPKVLGVSIDLLVKHKILNREKIIESKNWDYVQIAKLYE